MSVRKFGIAGLSSLLLCAGWPAVADTIELNGLPCNDWCQQWMGVAPPHSNMAPQGAALDETFPETPAKAPVSRKALKHVKKRAVSSVAKALPMPAPVLSPLTVTASPPPSPHPAPEISAAPVETTAPPTAMKAPDASGEAAIAADAPAAAPTPAMSSAPASGEAEPASADAPKDAQASSPPQDATATAAAPQDAAPIAVAPPSDQTGSVATAAPQAPDPATATSVGQAAEPAAAPPPSSEAPAPVAEPETAAAPHSEPTPDASATAAAPVATAPNSESTPDASAAVAAPVPTDNSVVASTAPDASSVSAEPAVMIIIAKKDVKILDDIGDGPIVVAGPFDITNSAMNASLAAAVQKPVTLVEGSTSDVDRVLNGEIASAVVAILPESKAKDLPEFKDLNVFRVPVTR